MKSLKEHTAERNLEGYHAFPCFFYSHIDPEGHFFVPHHWHDELEFIYVEQGTLHLSLNGKKVTLSAGNVYFINMQDIHQITGDRHGSIHHAIVFKPIILEYLLQDPCYHLYLAPIISANYKLVFDINDHPEAVAEIISAFKHISKASTKNNISTQLQIRADILNIIATLINHHLLIKNTRPSTKDKLHLNKTLLSYIHENYTQKITINDLATLSNMSNGYFCKFFKATFNKSAIEYINEYRIERAATLLKETDEKIISICFSVGFDNFSYFIKKFKQIKNSTPSTYRNQSLQPTAPIS